MKHTTSAALRNPLVTGFYMYPAPTRVSTLARYHVADFLTHAEWLAWPILALFGSRPHAAFVHLQQEALVLTGVVQNAHAVT